MAKRNTVSRFLSIFFPFRLLRRFPTWEQRRGQPRDMIYIKHLPDGVMLTPKCIYGQYISKHSLPNRVMLTPKRTQTSLLVFTSLLLRRLEDLIIK